MGMKMVWWALAVSMMLPTTAQAKQDRVAVLQLRNTAGLEAQEVDYLTDLVRGAALEVLPQAKYLVMTNESILELLPPGTDLEACIGECEVETGRKLGARYLVTGDVLKFGKSFRVRLSLYETKTAQLVAQGVASGGGVEALEAPVGVKSKEMFAKLDGARGKVARRQDVALPSVNFDDLPDATGDEAPTGDTLNLGDLAQARAQRKQAEREETERRAEAARKAEALRRAEAEAKRRAQAKYNARIDEAWKKTRTHTRDGGPRAVAAVERFIKAYKDGPFENPRAVEADALKQRLLTEIQEARQAKHDAKVSAQWARVKTFVKAGGPEAKVALRRFMKMYKDHELGNPVAEEAEAAMAKLEGRAVGKARVEFIRIPGGRFQMGSNSGDSDEKPVHRVNVPTFYLAKTEVTVAQYRACVEAGACTEPKTGSYYNWGESGRDEHPINGVDWHQARKFSAWAGGRLPSEAEWEYAARSGGRDQTYPWGDAKLSCSMATMSGCPGETQNVCSHPRGNSAQGLCDLAGNVWEWTEDVYAKYELTPRDGSAHSSAGSHRVSRGGGWYGPAQGLRAAYRLRAEPGARNYYLGFRPARSVP